MACLRFGFCTPRSDESNFTQPSYEIAVEGGLGSCMLWATFFLVVFFVITIIIRPTRVRHNGGGDGGAIMKLPVMRRLDATQACIEAIARLHTGLSSVGPTLSS